LKKLQILPAPTDAEAWARQGNDRSAVIVTCSLDGKIKKVEVINYK
jgi:hypothetical protein